jgi:flagellar protein FlaG
MINPSENPSRLPLASNTNNFSISDMPSRSGETKERTVVSNDQNQSDEKKLHNEDVRKKIEKAANAVFDGLNTDMVFKFYEKSEEWYAVIEDKFTQKVIKELPPKAILNMHAQLKNMIGFFLDKKI